MKAFLPNLLTLSNLACGLLALLHIFERQPADAAWYVAFALVFDFLDGFTARALNVSGELGKQLDSLADVVTFGVVPGFIMYHMFYEAEFHSARVANTLPYIAFLIPLFSAYRLAKFNIDARQGDRFIGLPTPANAIFILSLPLITTYSGATWAITWLAKPETLAMICMVMSYLLVAEIPLFALKFKNYRFRDNYIKFFFLLVSGAIIPLFGFVAIPFIILLYIIISIIQNIIMPNEIQS